MNGVLVNDQKGRQSGSVLLDILFTKFYVERGMVLVGYYLSGVLQLHEHIMGGWLP